ncbi:MAG: DUF4440 domain-containing protein [Gammaproteobacteria bacterium]|nr:DUF4440 domain-containing protein [Woeseia sp.]MBT8103081.1 DUF4440 domain-containing protein [Gammaproteobacteria bacterium]
MTRLIVSMTCLLVLGACAQDAAPGDPSDITSRSDAWEAALNAKDIDTLVSLYTDDARVMPPGYPLSTGSDAVRDAFSGMIAAGFTGTLTPVDTRVAGDIGYNVGTFELTMGDGTVTTGKFAETWERGSDGVWRISNDIWNDDGSSEPAMGDKSHIVILHDVEDYDHWIAAWRGDNSRHELFEANGAAHVHTLQRVDNPNSAGLVVSVSDLDALFEMLESDAGQAAASEDRVVMDSMVVLKEVN